jgi:hypothetical protein
LYRCEVVKLEGQSYRMENRKNIFTPEWKKQSERCFTPPLKLRDKTPLWL